VISGYNTDIEYEGTVYHVQTEDKGLDMPMILSLVYTGGEILASKRSSYEDIIAAGFDENVLADRLHRQHKLICAAILAGRIEDLRRMSERDYAARAAARSSAAARIKEDLSSKKTQVDTEDLLDIPMPIELDNLEIGTSAETITIPVSAIAREVVPDLSIDETDEKEALAIKLLDEKPLRGGERVMLRVLVSNGENENSIVNGADVLVKVLGSTFRPLVFQSRTGPNGVATIRMQLPHFTTGRAAILIRASAEGHDVEIRRIVNQG
jgi:hypothetical protein